MTSSLAQDLLADFESQESLARLLKDDLQLSKTPLDAYHYVVRLVTSFAETQVTRHPYFVEWRETVRSVDELYSPSESSESPLSQSYFALWCLFDLRFSPDKISLGELLLEILERLTSGEEWDKTRDILTHLCQSRMGIYQLVSPTQLQEVITDRVFDISPVEDGHQSPGALWYARLGPPLAIDQPWVILFQPYILSEATAQEWTQALQAELSEHLELPQFLKYGSESLCWHEYIDQAYDERGGPSRWLSATIGPAPTRAPGRDLSPKYPSVSQQRLPSLSIDLNLTERQLLTGFVPHLTDRMSAARPGTLEIDLTMFEVLESVAALTDALPLLSTTRLDACHSLLATFQRAAKDLQAALEPASQEDGRASDQDLLLSVRLAGSQEVVTRSLRVPSTRTLGQLHSLLQIAMGWEDYHPYEFEIQGERFSPPHFDTQGDGQHDVPLHVCLEPGDSFTYRYDFGDGWELEGRVLRAYQESSGRSRLVAGTGPAPPEDCGGVPGFEERLRVLRDPERPGFDDDNYEQVVDDDNPNSCARAKIDRELFCYQAASPASQEELADESLELAPGLGLERLPLNTTSSAGEAMDLVLLVECPTGWVLAAEPIRRSAGIESVVSVAAEALTRTDPGYGTLQVVDEELCHSLEQRLQLAVKLRTSLPKVERSAAQISHTVLPTLLSFAPVGDEVLAQFLEVATRFYLQAPWLSHPDVRFFQVDGLADQPRLLSILGETELEFGLAVLDDPLDALNIVRSGEPPQSSTFAVFLEDGQTLGLRGELRERGQEDRLTDVVPYVLTTTGPGQEHHYRLLSQAMEIALACGTADKGNLDLVLSTHQHVQVSWPCDLARLIG